MDTDKKIIVKDLEGQELKSFSFADRDRAFDFLKELESYGVEAVLDEPSLPETLISALGAGQEDKDKLRQEIDEEIHDHTDIDSCCFKKN